MDNKNLYKLFKIAEELNPPPVFIHIIYVEWADEIVVKYLKNNDYNIARKWVNRICQILNVNKLFISVMHHE